MVFPTLSLEAWMMRVHALALLGGLLVLGAGCANSDDPTQEEVDISGTWTFVIDVTQANGGCEGEEVNGPDDPSTNTITITVSPAPGDPGRVLVEMAGFLGSNANVASTVRDPVRLNSVIAVTGSWPEDGGITTTTFTLEVESANRMTGGEVWEWEFDGSLACPLGLSDVTATRS